MPKIIATYGLIFVLVFMAMFGLVTAPVPTLAVAGLLFVAGRVAKGHTS